MLYAQDVARLSITEDTTGLAMGLHVWRASFCFLGHFLRPVPPSLKTQFLGSPWGEANGVKN